LVDFLMMEISTASMTYVQKTRIHSAQFMEVARSARVAYDWDFLLPVEALLIFAGVVGSAQARPFQIRFGKNLVMASLRLYEITPNNIPAIHLSPSSGPSSGSPSSEVIPPPELSIVRSTVAPSAAQSTSKL